MGLTAGRTKFAQWQATLVSNDTSFEEMRWTLMQTPQEQWNAVSAKKLAEANEKFQKFTQVGERFVMSRLEARLYNSLNCLW